MISKTIKTAGLSFVAVATVVAGGVIPAHAAGLVSTTSNLGVSTTHLVSPISSVKGSSTTKVAKDPTTSDVPADLTMSTPPTTIKADADAAIEARLTKLQNESKLIAGMKDLSSTEAAAFQTSITTNINGLTALKAKIDGESDVTTLLSDYKSIFTSYRIYSLFVPQLHLLAAADVMTAHTTTLSALATKLQAEITAGNTSTVIQGELNDMKAMIADAQAKASATTGLVSGLVPDMGDKTVQASNHTAIHTARHSDISVGRTDLDAARADAKKIEAALGLTGKGGSATLSTTSGLK
jgi:hypothetical protein